MNDVDAEAIRLGLAYYGSDHSVADRLKALVVIFGDDWSDLGHTMSLRLLRESQLAFLSGADSACVLSAIGACRQVMSNRLFQYEDISPEPGTTLASLMANWSLSAGDGIDTREIEALEERYLAWSPPLTGATVEAELIENASDAQARELSADELVYRDAVRMLELLKLIAFGEH